MKQLDYLNVTKPTVVTDNGFCSQENIIHYIQNHIKFVTRATRSEGKWVKDSIDQNLSLLDDINNVIDFDNDITGTCITIKPTLSYTAKYSCSSHKKGDKIKLTPRLYLGIFRSRSRAYEAERNFTQELYQLKAYYFSDTKKYISKYSINT